MLPDQNEPLMRALLAPARALEPSDTEVANVLTRVSPAAAGSRASRRLAGQSWPLAAGRRRAPASGRVRPRPSTAGPKPLGVGQPRSWIAALAALVLVAAGLWSVPATRAALEDAGSSVGGTFSGWVGGDSAEAPGRPLRTDETAAEPTPTYLYDPKAAKEPRVIAEADGYKLYSYIGSSGGLNFLLGAGFGEGFESVAELGDAPLHVLGPGTLRHVDAEGHIPLYGIAARSVKSVELTYASGPPLRLDDIEGAYVLLAEPARGPQEVLALDADGKVLGHESVTQDDWQRYLLPRSAEPPPPGSTQGG
jgi:hypothetical protein